MIASTLTLPVWTLVVAIVAVVAIVSFLRQRESKGESFLSNVFKSNNDFDTTIGLIGMFGIIFVMILCFHDDLSNQIPMVFLMAFYALRDIVTGKKNGNGHTEDENVSQIHKPQ